MKTVLYLLTSIVITFTLTSCASPEVQEIEARSKPSNPQQTLDYKAYYEKRQKELQKLKDQQKPLKSSKGKRSFSNKDKTFYKHDKYTIINMLYGTDRKENFKRGKYYYEDFFGTERGKLSYGLAEISIPLSHKFGAMERPTQFFKVYEDENSEKHIMIQRINPLKFDEFVSTLNAKVKNANEKDIMIFVHGFNNTFGDAIRRAAQLTYDLRFEGIPITYSWPSQGGGVSTYMQDESSVQYTTPHLVDFLINVLENANGADVHIIGHSMGTRAVTNALKKISYIFRNKEVFTNVILAAPDIDRDVFEVNLLPYVKKTTKMLTLYASSDDSALQASKTLHNAPRLGQSDDIFIYEGLNTIDATGIDTSALGHSYFAEKEVIVKDLKDLIYKSLPPEKREKTLSKKQKNEFIYWKVKVSNDKENSF
jgi:esterase/lipase superfamily enzyme